jgi:hypothetical protein
MMDTNEHLHEIWVGIAASVKREELFRLFVCESIRDRYMTIGHLENVAGRCGIGISRHEMLRALHEFIELGQAKAYDLDRREWLPPEYDGMPPLEDITPWVAYFGVTREGLEFHDARDSWWPFDWDDDADEWVLRKDWVAPDA